MNVDFPLILFCLTLAAGAAWLADVVLWRGVRTAAQAVPARHVPEAAGPALRRQRRRTPAAVAFLAGIFPVLLAVFVVRSFLFEPFRIPSGSMLPTLEVGDFILVNKFAYGLRLPVLHRDVLPIGTPRRGDVVVFRYPPDPSENYVKRVVGLPGDTVVYRDKRVAINGRPVHVSDATAAGDAVVRATEALPNADGPVAHAILLDARRADPARAMTAFPSIEACRYDDRDGSVACKVPAHHYFVMGDNRDNSADSRSWGFVPDENLVGRAVFVWMNFTAPGRIGPFR